jgi:hypothetical protein
MLRQAFFAGGRGPDAIAQIGGALTHAGLDQTVSLPYIQIRHGNGTYAESTGKPVSCRQLSIPGTTVAGAWAFVLKSAVLLRQGLCFEKAIGDVASQCVKWDI